VSRTKPRPRSELAAEIGHSFKSEKYLKRALTHPSVNVGGKGDVVSNYERLEFLGDRVLGLVIAHLLFERFPESREGALATRYNALVRKEACAAVAERIGLGDYLRLSPGEASAGGRRKTAILGNACEALIAAVYLDAGYDGACAMIERYWVPLLDEVERPLKDPKTMLQEWVQGRGLPAPHYRMDERSGPDHAPRFMMTVEVDGMPAAEGEGSSKRAAEQDAAERFLVREGIMKP
jgi:ribonuclease-3